MQRRFSAHLRMLRQRAALTQRQLADLAGVSAATIRDIEQGRIAAPRTGTIRRLAEALELAVGETADLIHRSQSGRRPADDLWIQILGPLSVQVHGEQVTIASAGQRLLLAALAISANSPVGSGRLAEMIWAHRPPSGVPALLRGHTAGLRRRLRRAQLVTGAPLVSVTPDGHQLTVAENQIDLLYFRMLVEHARRSYEQGQCDLACRLLAEATGCWRGEPLADLPPLRDDPAVTGLRREWQAAVSLYAESALLAGRPEEVLPLLRRAVETDPFHETFGAQLVRALHAIGESTAANGLFHELRQRLADTFGTDPGPELLRAGQSAQWRATTGLPQVTVERELPPPSPEFAGRTEQLRTLHQHLARSTAVAAAPVLTMVGLGGSGKTSLALHFAHELLTAGRYPDAALWVELRGSEQPPVDPAVVLARLLRLCGVTAEQAPPDLAGRSALLRDRLAGMRTLLVLDDAAGREQVLPLLPANPSCLVLVTSRRALALDGARVVPVGELSPQSARQLLTQLLGRRRIDAEPDAAHRLASQCGHLPAALSMAARRLRARSRSRIADLVDRLDRAPDPLRELAAGTDRLRSVFDRSYRRLNDDQRRLLQELSRHPREEVTAAAIADLVDLPLASCRRELDRLVDEHVVTALTGERYRLPELLRWYARSAPTGP